MIAALERRRTVAKQSQGRASMRSAPRTLNREQELGTGRLEVSYVGSSTFFFPRRFVMRTGRFSLWSAFTALGLLASLACGTRAHANDLNLGGSFNSGGFYTFDGSSPGGGGPINTSYLNGVQLPYVYCIDIPDNVNVPVDYPKSTVTNNGMAIVGSGNPQYNNGGLALTPNAGTIAWLLTQYALTATTTTKQDALQAAIWTAIYGYNTPGYALVVTNSAVFQQMQTDLGNNPNSSTVTLANAGTASVSN